MMVCNWQNLYTKQKQISFGRETKQQGALKNARKKFEIILIFKFSLSIRHVGKSSVSPLTHFMFYFYLSRNCSRLSCIHLPLIRPFFLSLRFLTCGGAYPIPWLDALLFLLAVVISLSERGSLLDDVKLFWTLHLWTNLWQKATVLPLSYKLVVPKGTEQSLGVTIILKTYLYTYFLIFLQESEVWRCGSHKLK